MVVIPKMEKLNKMYCRYSQIGMIYKQMFDRYSKKGEVINIVQTLFDSCSY